MLPPPNAPHLAIGRLQRSALCCGGSWQVCNICRHSSVFQHFEMLCAGGDACIFAAAFFYSLATVRLSRLAANVAPLRLATAKSMAFAVIALCWLALSAANQVGIQ